MTTEVWIETRYPGYWVSSLGRVRGRKGNVIKGSPTQGGYRKVPIYGNHPVLTRNIHILICETFHGPRPDGLEVRHLDGNKSNNRPDNLAWGTARQNYEDRVTHGTQVDIGEFARQAKVVNGRLRHQ